MTIKFLRFNTIFCVALLLFWAAGCNSDKPKKKFTGIELHLEENPDNASDVKSITFFRDSPITLNVAEQPFLDTPDLADASVVNNLGGFKIQLKWNWRGTQLLSATTAANRGSRIAVYCVFGENRWLAAPTIDHIITDGVFSFTPDATREESDRIVKGLNEVIKSIKEKEDKEKH